jgi:hypothetical protein
MILAIQSVRLDASNGESVNLGEMGAESDAFCRCFLFPSPSLYTDDPYIPPSNLDGGVPPRFIFPITSLAISSFI